jgi:hypothetical protein
MLYPLGRRSDMTGRVLWLPKEGPLKRDEIDARVRAELSDHPEVATVSIRRTGETWEVFVEPDGAVGTFPASTPVDAVLSTLQGALRERRQSLEPVRLRVVETLRSAGLAAS